MKKTIVFIVTLFPLFITALFGQQSSVDPILMEVNDKKITRSEFLQIYLKNNNNPKYDRQTLDEYISLYKKFQLKVAEAEAQGYDTIERLKIELEGYQDQLAQPYLTDAEMNQRLVDQSYERLKKEVRASHILIKIDANAEDSISAYNRAMEVREKLLKGEKFADVALQYSNDESVSNNHGDLGYFTAFQMVYPFEDVAYNLAINEISMPVRTKFGYHILKVTDIRNARGTMTVAHLMLSARKNIASTDEMERAKDQIGEIYQKLIEGENFDSLVRLYSDDPGTKYKDGVLPEFGTGTTTRLLPEFEQTAFELKNNGDFSQPIQTEFGYHIIKRISWRPLKPFNELKKELENKVKHDSRSQLTRQSFIEKLKKEYNFQTVNAEKNIEWLANNIDSSIYEGEFDLTKFDIALEPLFVLNNVAYTLPDFVKYINENKRQIKNVSINNIPKKIYSDWENLQVINVEKSKLFDKYSDYKSLMKEYHDGILLYEIMNDNVWNKAVKDTTGLKEFYQQNKNSYMWEKRYELTSFQTNNKENAEKIYKLIKKKTPTDSIIKQLSKNSSLDIKLTHSGKFEESKIAYIKDHSIKKGLNKPYQTDGHYYVVNVKKIIKPQTKEIYEARGIITSDYQNFLEKTWLEELEKKHKVIIHEDILYSLEQQK